MLSIKAIAEVASVPRPLMRAVIQASLAKLLADHPGSYDPEGHGWFLILEDLPELDDVSPFHGRFSVRQVIEGQCFEWLGLHDDFVELVVVLDDSEAVAVFVPHCLLTEPALMEVVNVHGVPAA